MRLSFFDSIGGTDREFPRALERRTGKGYTLISAGSGWEVAGLTSVFHIGGLSGRKTQFSGTKDTAKEFTAARLGESVQKTEFLDDNV